MIPSQNEKLRHILQYAYDNAPAVKTVFDGVSLLPDQIQTLSDLEKVPVTTKDRLAELQQADPPFGGFLAIPLEKLEHIFLSPGPLYEPHAALHRFWIAYARCWRLPDLKLAMWCSTLSATT